MKLCPSCGHPASWGHRCDATSSEGGGNREHLSSVKAAAAPDPEAYGRDHEFRIHSPHGDWNVVVSMYAMDSLPASTLAGHAKNQPRPGQPTRIRLVLRVQPLHGDVVSDFVTPDGWASVCARTVSL